MPNHIHGIIEIIIVDQCVGVPLVGTPKRATTRVAPTVGDVVGAYKSLSTNEYIQNVKQNNLVSV